MSFVIAALVCSQVVLPSTRRALEFGDVQAQQYPASVGAIAWKPDGGLGAIWLDGRRGLGEAAPGNRVDLWGAKLVLDAPQSLLDPTGVLLVSAPASGVLESPAIAFNSGLAAIVWLERRPAMTTVRLALGNEEDASILVAPQTLAMSAGVTSVTVSAAGGGFIVAWSNSTQITRVRIDATGAQTVPVNTQIAGTQAASRVLVTGFIDGGSDFAYSTGPAPRAGFFTHDYTSPTSDAGLLFDTSGALAGIGFQGGVPSLLLRTLSGELQNRTSSLASTAVTSTRLLSECVVAGNEDLSALAFVDPIGISQVGFIASSGGVNVIEAPRAEAVAIAANSTQAAYLRRVEGLSVVTRVPAAPSLEAPIELNLAQPTQRAPSVAWLPDAGGFVVAWEERGTAMDLTQRWLGRLAFVRLDGGTDDLGSTRPAQALTVSPRVVEWDQSSVGVEDQGTTSRSHQHFNMSSGLAPPNAIQGLDWRSSAGPPLLRWREGAAGTTTTEQSGSNLTLPITSPRCATTVNGKHLLAGWSGSTPLLYEVLGATSNFSTISSAVVAAQGSFCITRGRDGSEALAAWSQGDSIRVLPIGRYGAPQVLISGPTGSIAYENPVATRLGSGVLVVWETPPAYSSIGAVYVDDARPTFPVSIALRAGSELVRHPTVASAPGGPAIVVWQEFDGTAGVGATRVRARLVFPPAPPPPDAGVDAGVPDAGTVDAGNGVIDAGVMDAGEFDGGVMDAGEFDGGVMDAGAFDAGVIDAGEADAGQQAVPDAGDAPPPLPAQLTFTSSCGCSGGPGSGALVLLALWATRRRKNVVR